MRLPVWLIIDERTAAIGRPSYGDAVGRLVALRAVSREPGAQGPRRTFSCVHACRLCGAIASPNTRSVRRAGVWNPQRTIATICAARTARSASPATSSASHANSSSGLCGPFGRIGKARRFLQAAENKVTAGTGRDECVAWQQKCPHDFSSRPQIASNCCYGRVAPRYKRRGRRRGLLRTSWPALCGAATLA